MIDKDEILRALRLWFRPGDVFEVRVLDASTGEYQRPHVESGYFDYDHIAAVPEALNRLRSYRGAYVTVNPVNPALLARAVNRIRPVNREPTTSDADIVERRWILFDCDAIRPSGISSSDEEHAHALAKAEEIRDGLSTLGWPEPIMTDSGNGAQLMYRTELPIDDGGLVQRIITEVATASDEHVDIDLTVYNPARIWRLPGTLNCKGDHTEARPHRMARIIAGSAPENIVHATLIAETLTHTAPDAPAIATNVEPDITGLAGNAPVVPPAFALDAWVSVHCPELGAPSPWQGGRKWLFPVCPFNDTHTDKSAVLIEQPSGAVVFRCHHNSCSGKDWFALRELREPGYQTREQFLPTSLTAVANEPEIIVPDEPEILKPWQQITAESIEQMLQGTFLGELATLYSSVTRPPLPIEGALMKAIITAACCLTGEASPEELQRRYGGNLGAAIMLGADRARLKINTAGGQMCNVYGMIVANSASGKDIGNLISKFSRMHNPCIRFADGENVVADWDLGTSGSAEGLANVLIRKPNGLLCISEMSNWLDVHHWQNKATSFLTEAFGQGYYNQNFSDRGRGGSSRRVDYCCPNILANIQPGVFDRLVHMQDIDTGFLGRFIMMKMPEFYGNPARFDSVALMEQMRVITEVFLRKKGVIELEENYSDELQQMFLGQCDPKLNPSWRRLCNEYYPRFMVMLSVTHAIKSQGESVIITDDARNRAKMLTLWLFAHAEKVLLGVTDDIGNSREVEQKLKRIFEIVRDSDRGNGVLTSEISRKSSGTGTTAKQRQEFLQELRERQWVKFENNRYSVLLPPAGLAKVRR